MNVLVNRQCEYEEYKAIMVAGFLAECKNPYFMWKNKFGADFLEDPGNDNLTPDVFVTSDWFEMEMRQQYSQIIKAYLLDREWYKVVDALEEVSNFWSFGRDWTTMPTYNVYVPTRTHIMDKPDMMDGEKDDLGYRMNVDRVSPYHYLNTLKGYKMMP